MRMGWLPGAWRGCGRHRVQRLLPALLGCVSSAVMLVSVGCQVRGVGVGGIVSSAYCLLYWAVLAQL